MVLEEAGTGRLTIGGWLGTIGGILPFFWRFVPCRQACGTLSAVSASNLASEVLDDDAYLIGATLAGDSSAFGRLVGTYQDRLFNSLLRVLGSADDAADITQDAFVQAFTKLDSFRGSSAFYTWLYRIAFNLAMSHRRRGRKTQSLDGLKSAQGSEPADCLPSAETKLLQHEQAEMVHAALAELELDYRQIIVLREMDGCSYEEIAELLELPIGTVRSRLFRARLQLRDLLAPRLAGERPALPR